MSTAKKSKNPSLSRSEYEARKRLKSIFLSLYLKYKNDSCLINRSGVLLGIDVLRNEIKRELLKIITLTLEERLLYLIDNPHEKETIQDHEAFVFNIIQTSFERISIKFYGLPINFPKDLVRNSFYIKALLEDISIVLVVPFYSVLNLQQKKFLWVFAPVYSEVTNKILEILFDNFVITISECLIRLILNEFTLVEDICQKWFRSNFLSTRNLERFKNNLAWQDRKRIYIRRASNIYNNEYDSWVLTADGFYLQNIYANRLAELLRLNRQSLVVVNYIEFQDFFLCRLEEAIVIFGQSGRFLLTSVVGQVIGLIWKGIIEALKE
uniref:hypothetical protein n=1 Tax=Chrysotila carterae TaxID=13221 RepID=UPI0022F2E948|nr:hypothetical protein PKF17_pgp106 [Chrysotila carterae]WAK83143.1 hypothetical protein [Chrysotila carterae]